LLTVTDDSQNEHPIMPETTKSTVKLLEPFVCGGSAATFASVVIHPIDLAKGTLECPMSYAYHFIFTAQLQCMKTRK
jgi:hypothetical protein